MLCNLSVLVVSVRPQRAHQAPFYTSWPRTHLAHAVLRGLLRGSPEEDNTRPLMLLEISSDCMLLAFHAAAAPKRTAEQSFAAACVPARTVACNNACQQKLMGRALRTWRHEGGGVQTLRDDHLPGLKVWLLGLTKVDQAETQHLWECMKQALQAQACKYSQG